eukprot:Skav217700  [mRNA]  locus=scaffold2294:39727:42490:- [translate_table: standard]
MASIFRAGHAARRAVYGKLVLQRTNVKQGPARLTFARCFSSDVPKPTPLQMRRLFITSAAMGQVMSDTCGVAFGGTIEAAALKLGLPLPNLSDAQQRMGSICGVIVGCFIGMGNLLIIDLKAAEKAKKEKELAKIMKTVMEDGRPEMARDGQGWPGMAWVPISQSKTG